MIQTTKKIKSKYVGVTFHKGKWQATRSYTPKNNTFFKNIVPKRYKKGRSIKCYGGVFDLDQEEEAARASDNLWREMERLGVVVGIVLFGKFHHAFIC